MPSRWLGVVVSGDKVTFVDAKVSGVDPIEIQSDQTLKLQTGDREVAYHVIYQQCANYIREHKIEKVFLKASALTTGSMKKAHLESAELRGVVIAAAASVCAVKSLSKATLSRTFGKRKVDEYVKDEEFWDENLVGVNIRGGSREAALLLLAGREE